MIPAFECRRCGHCCQGKGGIVLKPSDTERLAAHLGLTFRVFLETYALVSGGKPHLATGEDDFCIFFREGQGCAVHPARPDICRAWPFFRGNLVDEVSWSMVQEYCPGINAEAGHAEFARQGRLYLTRNGLLGRDPGVDPRALIMDPEPSDPDPTDPDPGPESGR